MAQHKADIVIFGAGIAGLWAFNHFKRAGYDVLLLEADKIGGGQSVCSQGILHSGLKYAFAGKISALAQSISAMPDLWREALRGEGQVDLRAARVNANSQMLLVPPGLMGGLVGLVTKQILGNGVSEIPREDWPEALRSSGFEGRAIFMGEPVLDIPSTIRSLTLGFEGSVKTIDTPDDPLGFLERHKISAKHIIFTGAASNARIAKLMQHDSGLETQARPLLMGMMRNAPFDAYLHLVGSSDKPVATITTHYTSTRERVWYIGGAAAERAKESPPRETYDAARKAFSKYFPREDFSGVEWAVLPIDRIEGKSQTSGWMPDTPTLHMATHGEARVYYCWPTKLTFAPLLTQRLCEHITDPPKQTQNDWSFLPDAYYAPAPWENAKWEKC